MAAQSSHFSQLRIMPNEFSGVNAKTLAVVPRETGAQSWTFVRFTRNMPAEHGSMNR
jgi:hypothetical protein